MSGTPASPTLFDLSGGHPALDLVNSLDNRFRDDGPNENLERYSDLLRFLGESDLLDARQIGLLKKSASGEAAERALHAAKELREATAAVFYAAMEEKTPAASGVLTLERHFLMLAGIANSAGTASMPTWRGIGTVLRPILTFQCGSSPSRCQISCSRTTRRACERARWTPAAGSFSTPARITLGVGAT
jgi:hypothetical protein